LIALFRFPYTELITTDLSFAHHWVYLWWL